MAKNFLLKNRVYLPLVMRETGVVRRSSSRNAQSCNHLHFEQSLECSKLSSHNYISGYWQTCTAAFGRTAEVKRKHAFQLFKTCSDYRRRNGGGEVFFMPSYLSRPHSQPPLTEGDSQGPHTLQERPLSRSHPDWKVTRYLDHYGIRVS